MSRGPGPFSWTTPSGPFPGFTGPFGHGLLYRIRAQFAFLTIVAGIVSLTIMPSGAAQHAAATASTWCTDKTALDVLGDSATTGDGIADPNNTWVAKLRGSNPTTKITTHAHGGAIVSDFLPGGRWPETTSAVDEIGAAKPALVIVELGGNEYYRDVDPAKYQADLVTLTNKLKAASPRSTLLYVTIWNFAPRLSTSVHVWNEYAEVTRQQAVKAGGWWIDLRQFFPGTHAEDANTKLIGPDGIHADDAGNAVVHAAVHTFLHRC
jgi:acyl-CoA thioesterase-1